MEQAIQRASDAQTADRYAEAATAYAEAAMLAPRTAELWANRGLMEHLAHDYATSAKSLSRAIALKPLLAFPYLFLGLDELELGHPTLAIPHLERAHALQPKDPKPESALGRAFLAVNKPRDAVDAYAAAAFLAPNNDNAWYDLGVASIAVIEQDGGTLASRFPDSPWARALYAGELLQQGRTGEAVTLYRAIAEASSPEECNVLRTDLAQSKQTAGSAVLAALGARGDDPVCSANSSGPLTNISPDAEHRRIACLFWSGSAAAAHAAGVRLAAAPNDPQALFWSVKASERQAVEALSRFEQLAPHSARTYDLLGDLDRRRDLPDSALDEYTRALAIAPRDPAALLGHAAALLALGRMDETIADTQDALADGNLDTPVGPQLNLILAEALIERHRFREANAPLQTALRGMASATSSGPGNALLTARAHALLGRVEAESGDISGAVADMTLGLPSDRDGSLSFQLSRLYRRQGNLAEAKRAEEHARLLQARRRENAVTAVEGHTEPAP